MNSTIKKTLLAAALLLLPLLSRAQPEYWVYDGSFNHYALGVTIGGDGIGAEIATTIARRMEFRIGYSYMGGIGLTLPLKVKSIEPWDIQQEVIGKASLTGSRVNAMLDIYPDRMEPFRFTIGCFYEINPDIIRGDTVEPVQIGEKNWGTLPYPVNGQQFTTDPEGHVHAGLTGNKFRPYIGIGMGHCLAKGRVKQYGLDAGIVYLGDLEPYTWDYSSGTAERVVFTPETMEVIEQETLGLRGAVKNMKPLTSLCKWKVMPVIRLTITFRVF